MKNKDLKKLNPSEMKEKLLELKTELMKYRSQISAGTPPENPGKVKSIRKTIARMNLLLHKNGMLEDLNEKQQVKKVQSKKQGVKKQSNARN